MYTIAPVNDLSKVRHVNRTLLKGRLGNEPPGHPTLSGPLTEEGQVSGQDRADGDDLCILVPVTPQPPIAVPLPLTAQSALQPIPAPEYIPAPRVTSVISNRIRTALYRRNSPAPEPKDHSRPTFQH